MLNNEFLEDLARFCEDNPVGGEDRFYGEAGVPPVCAGWNKGILGANEGCGTKPCVYKGVEYNSLTEAAEANGVTISAVSQYIKREGAWRYELPVTYKGVEYPNLRECARITGAPYSSVATWVRRHR